MSGDEEDTAKGGQYAGGWNMKFLYIFSGADGDTAGIDSTDGGIGVRIEIRSRSTCEYEENSCTTNADDPLSSVPKIAFGNHKGRNWDHNQSHAPVRSRM